MYFAGILSDSLRIAMAELNSMMHVALYPGSAPLTLVISTLFVGSLCMSVGSANFSVQPCDLNVMEKRLFSNVSGLGPSWLTHPPEKNVGY